MGKSSSKGVRGRCWGVPHCGAPIENAGGGEESGAQWGQLDVGRSTSQANDPRAIDEETVIVIPNERAGWKRLTGLKYISRSPFSFYHLYSIQRGAEMEPITFQMAPADLGGTLGCSKQGKAHPKPSIWGSKRVSRRAT